jgi:hypothetical protein
MALPYAFPSAFGISTHERYAARKAHLTGAESRVPLTDLCIYLLSQEQPEYQQDTKDQICLGHSPVKIGESLCFFC